MIEFQERAQKSRVSHRAGLVVHKELSNNRLEADVAAVAGRN